MGVITVNDLPPDVTQEQIASLTGPTTPAASILNAYLESLRKKEVKQLLKMPQCLEGVELAAGQLTVIGAPPATGKTALAMMMAFGGLEQNEGLSVVIANAEMGFECLLQRELTRLTRINSEKIRFANLDDNEMYLIERAVVDLVPRLSRVSVLNEPCNLTVVALRVRTVVGVGCVP